MKRALKLPALAAALAAAVLLAFAACERTPAPPSVALRIGVLQAQDALPYFVIRERALDRKHGLLFTETTLTSGAAALDALLADTLDLAPGIATVPLLAAAERGLIPGKIVPVAAGSFADREHRAAGILAARSVQGWKDLDGKGIGTNVRSSILTAAAESRLRHEGVRGYTFIEFPIANLGLAVAGGNVAAAVLSEPHLTQSLLRGDGKLLDWVIGGPPFERMQYSTIVASAEFRRRSPQGVKAYLRAHLAAVRWINEHPAEARALLARRLTLSPEVAAKINLLRFPTDARSDPALLEGTQHVLLAAGVLERPVDVRRLHDQTLLEEVLKEAR